MTASDLKGMEAGVKKQVTVKQLRKKGSSQTTHLFAEMCRVLFFLHAIIYWSKPPALKQGAEP